MTDETLLSERNPLPDKIPARLRDQLHFVIEVDRLKTIVRRSPLAATERRENDAEHSWHLAMMVLLLAEYSDEPIDVGHTIQLVLVHDLIEIYAGDTFVFDDAATASQEQRERQAADRLFPLLPDDQAKRLRALWDEFEQRATAEARFAKAMDRLEPFLLNWMAHGGTWETPGVTAADVRKRQRLVGDASTPLGEAAEQLIEESQRRGWLRPAP